GSVITPARVQAQVWLSLAGGAMGVGYLTDVVYPPAIYIRPNMRTTVPTDFGVAPDVAAMARLVNGRLAEIQPALLGDRVTAVHRDSGPVRVGARSYGGVTYVIAVNTSKASARGTFTAAALTNGNADVLW